MNDILIQLKNINFSYDSSRPLFENLEFSLRRGERVGVVGSTGAGKSSFIHLLVGLIIPGSGDVEIFGRSRCAEKDFVEVRGPVGLLFQDSDDQLFCPTVAEDVAFGPLNLGKGHDQTAHIVKGTLDRLGLAGYEDRVTYKLSGGEKRLVALATVLAMEPEILLLDEPTAGLDDDSASRVEKTLSELDLAMVLISHDHDLVSRLTDRTLRLREGRLEA